MLNFVCYLDGNKHQGSQFEQHNHSRLEVVNINRNSIYLQVDEEEKNCSRKLSYTDLPDGNYK